MIVQAKCIQRAWDSTQARLFTPDGGPLTGGLYELDLSKPEDRKLADLKNAMRQFIFQFDRVAANKPLIGLYFCSHCGVRFESLNLLGSHSRSEHKLEPEVISEPISDPELEEEEIRIPGTNAAGDHRGIGPRTCKGCGQPFENVNALGQHKKSCTRKPSEVVTPDVIQETSEVGQAAPPA